MSISRRAHRDDEKIDHRHQRDQDVARAAHLDEDGGAEAEGDHREQLVGDAEDRPEGVDAAERIDHALIQEPAPAGHEQRAGRTVAGPGLRCRPSGFQT